jgi:hypothetical protein
MSELSWKTARYVLLFYPAVFVFVAWYVTGFGRLTCGLAIATVALLLTAPAWTTLWITRLERPAARRESVQYASLGIVGVLFLRAFAMDRYWRGLQEFLLDIVRAHDARYATWKTVIALGDDDERGIAKLRSTDDEWVSQINKLGDAAEAIVILPVHPKARTTSGIVQEIVHALVSYSDKTIFVMPPRAVWERDLAGSPLAGQLERLWAEMNAVMGERAPSLRLLPYEPQGCFWTMHEDHGHDRATRYGYSEAGAAAVLFKVLDDQRIKRNLFIQKYDPQGYAALRQGTVRSPFPDDLLL